MMEDRICDQCEHKNVNSRKYPCSGCENRWVKIKPKDHFTPIKKSAFQKWNEKKMTVRNSCREVPTQEFERKEGWNAALDKLIEVIDEKKERDIVKEYLMEPIEKLKEL